MYSDEKCYQFHEKDKKDRCFVCGQSSERFLILRHIGSAKLVHLCLECMVENIEDYLLDNTKPWRN
jgi:hypothetical protein